MEAKRFKKIKQYVILRDGLICAYCDKILTEDSVTLDHIVPSSKRGTFNTTNLTVSCFDCNNKRGSRPLFDFLKKINANQQKIDKYKKLYFNNLKIKILNIAKEECLIQEKAVPVMIINQACTILKVNMIDFSSYETILVDISFKELYERRIIKYYFEKLIKIIESDNG